MTPEAEGVILFVERRSGQRMPLSPAALRIAQVVSEMEQSKLFGNVELAINFREGTVTAAKITQSIKF